MTTVAPPAEAPSSARIRRKPLAQSIAALRTRTAKISLENLFLTVGALCLPVGIVVIVLGWYGAAHTGHLYEQNDYLISGGLLGLGLIFIGGFLYFGYWMSRQIRATETGSRQTLRALAKLEGKMTGASSAGAAAGVGAVFVVTEHGSMFHRPTCPTVTDKNVRIVDHPEPTRHRPCGICMSGA